MEAICKIYEEHLKKLNPNKPCIQVSQTALLSSLITIH